MHYEPGARIQEFVQACAGGGLKKTLEIIDFAADHGDHAMGGGAASPCSTSPHPHTALLRTGAGRGCAMCNCSYAFNFIICLNLVYSVSHET